MIWENRTKIISAFEQSGSTIEQFRNPERIDVDEALLNYFKQTEVTTTTQSGPLFTIAFVLPKF